MPTDLRPYNTLALPGQAAQWLSVTDTAQLAELPCPPRFVLGGGSNLVLTGDVDGLVLHMALRGRQIREIRPDGVLVEAAAGENWHDFVLWTLEQGWGGLENLALIPGTVGAAPIQNIGAYGLEAGERLHSLDAWDIEAQRFVTLDRTACRFGYRDSLFKQEGWHLHPRLIITSVRFLLPRPWQPNARYADVQQELAAMEIAEPSARDIAAAVITIRQRKLPDPVQLPNCGSFFHNPVVPAEQAAQLKARHPHLPCYPQADGRVKLAAGWLIEQAGWKGRWLGPMGMFEKQALVLVHKGTGTYAELAALVASVQKDVSARFGVSLTPEPVFL